MVTQSRASPKSKDRHAGTGFHSSRNGFSGTRRLPLRNRFTNLAVLYTSATRVLTFRPVSGTDDVSEAKSNLYANLALAGLGIYVAVLVFATLDEFLGWGLLAPYF